MTSARLVFLGPPGVGKGTQAVRLAQKLAIPHISTGDLLRAETQARSPLGLQAKSYMDKGSLVPDDLVVALVDQRLTRADARNGYLLDGFPRTLAQANALEDRLRTRSEHIDRVLYFHAPDEILVRRLSGRRSCPKCAANYHVETMPPKKDSICDKCGTALIQRKDDQPETIQNRLKVYRDQTHELIEHYRAASLLREIDSTGSVDQIATAAARALTT